MNVHDEMSDNEVLRTASDCLSAMPMATPPDAEAIMARGRARRRRRLIPGVTGALALAAGAALAVTLPSGHQPSHPARAQLAAWTVTKQGDGDIRVTIHELRDPAALQRTLRADGVPVSVTFTGQANPACQPYGSGGSHLLESMVTALPGHGNLRVLVIHPSAFPAGAGLAIAAGHPGQSPRGGGVELTIGPPVKASPQCTGS